MLPRISVIIVVFNGEKTLENAIQSVFGQTYKNVELIIVDGGSTDRTIEILKRNKAENFIWKSEPDKGIYDAMNKGIKMANGEWVYFLGADDSFINDTVVETLFSNGRNSDCDFLYGNVYSLMLRRNYDGAFNKEKILVRNICHQAIFYKKDLYAKVGYYNINYRLFADWDFNIRCFFNSEIREKYVDVVIANFAKGGESMSNNDLPFFRNSLFLISLHELGKIGFKKLYNIIFYDRWWRLIRSMKLIQKNDNISGYAKNENLPLVIQRMHNFQKKIPYSILSIGFFSKFIMLISYLINLITIKFK